MILGVFVAPTHHFPIAICKECTLERNWGSRLQDPDFSFPSVFSLFLLSSVTHQKNGSGGNCSEIKLKSKQRKKGWLHTPGSEQSGDAAHQLLPKFTLLALPPHPQRGTPQGTGWAACSAYRGLCEAPNATQGFYMEPPGTKCPQDKWSHNWLKKAGRVNLWNIRLVATSVLNFTTISLLSTVKSCYLLPPTSHQADGRHSA